MARREDAVQCVARSARTGGVTECFFAHTGRNDAVCAFPDADTNPDGHASVAGSNHERIDIPGPRVRIRGAPAAVGLGKTQTGNEQNVHYCPIFGAVGRGEE